MPENKKLSIIVVSWNVKDLLAKCLESIAKFNGDLDLEVVVVDNNSSDGAQVMLQEKIQEFRGRKANWMIQLKVILNDENLGFAQGNNIGLRQASGDYILFLNPDTKLIDNSLQAMVEYLENHHEVGLVGPMLLNSDNSLQLSVRKFPDILSQVLILLKLHNFLPWLPVLKNYFQLDFNYSKEQEVDQLMGAALLTKKSVIKKLTSTKRDFQYFRGRENNRNKYVGNLFDPYFKRIYEEVDLQYRIKQVGFNIVYLPDAQIIHHKGTSFAKTRILQKQLDFNQGMRRFFWLHKPWWQYFIILLFQPVSIALTILQTVLANLGDPLRKKYKKAQL